MFTPLLTFSIPSQFEIPINNLGFNTVGYYDSMNVQLVLFYLTENHCLLMYYCIFPSLTNFKLQFLKIAQTFAMTL